MKKLLENFYLVVISVILSGFILISSVFLGKTIYEGFPVEGSIENTDNKPTENKKKSVVIPRIEIDVKNNQQKQCLIEALWYEARNQDETGIKAVANVIINRTKATQYPDTICKVVRQPKQFSYRNKIKQGKHLQINPKPSEIKVYNRIKSQVDNWFEKGFDPILDHSVLWYAKHSVRNYWTKAKVAVNKFGDHIFYKKPGNTKELK